MRERFRKRLNELKTEFESGQKMLTDLEQRQSNLKNTMLRISGAIQVLEEIIAAENTPVDKDNCQPINEYAEALSAVQEPAQ